MTRWLAALAFLAPAALAPGQPPPRQTLQDSADVLADLQTIPGRGIPASLVAEARAVAIIPRVIKAGFVFGGRGGHGVVLMRTQNGWSEPTFVNIGGASVGLQIGVQATDLVLVFRDRKALDRILDGKGKLTLGADAAVAAGPVGRQAQAGTDARLQGEILSYSRSRGLFAGVALDGAVLRADSTTNDAFQRGARPDEVRALAALRARLDEIAAEPTAGDRPPPGAVPPPGLPLGAPPPPPGPPPVVPDTPVRSPLP
jgi:lipid-binding SYLF domain-containing protein